ncbi:hypothetical protein Bbelb_341020 [Branchiostoma belcheri]|nr:hypothetical protein Bbelb_341020 [Branchiostoma belcheri]
MFVDKGRFWIRLDYPEIYLSMFLDEAQFWIQHYIQGPRSSESTAHAAPLSDMPTGSPPEGENQSGFISLCIQVRDSYDNHTTLPTSYDNNTTFPTSYDNNTTFLRIRRTTISRRSQERAQLPAENLSHPERDQARIANSGGKIRTLSPVINTILEIPTYGASRGKSRRASRRIIYGRDFDVDADGKNTRFDGGVYEHAKLGGGDEGSTISISPGPGRTRPASSGVLRVDLSRGEFRGRVELALSRAVLTERRPSADGRGWNKRHPSSRDVSSDVVMT